MLRNLANTVSIPCVLISVIGVLYNCVFKFYKGLKRSVRTLNTVLTTQIRLPVANLPKATE